ncbi:MAG: Nramp family divalent metal transporter [Leptospirales bacterium]|nr:Nramp family divalent metal transporter [Leptospirales bacterium]
MTFLAKLKSIGPGFLLAAAGIGASDFFGSVWAGTSAGTSVLWIVGVGAFLKYVITEGAARSQLVTGKTPVQRWMSLPVPVRWLLAGYFCFWSVCVSALLMEACGTAAAQLLPRFSENMGTNANIYSAVQGILALSLLSLRGYETFERMIKGLVVLTFALILYAGFSVLPSLSIEAQSLKADGAVMIALVTGIGGTLTILSYGYWLRESHEDSPKALNSMRLDCSVGYVLSAVFNLTMICVAAATLRNAGVSIASEGAAKAIFSQIGGLLGDRMGAWAINVGFWCVVAGSLLGVWQSIPYFFVDGLHAYKRQDPPADLKEARSFFWFRFCVVAFALPLLFFKIQVLFVLYAVVSSLFLPFLAGTLLIWNNQKQMGSLQNGILTNILLVLALAAYMYLAVKTIAAYV